MLKRFRLLWIEDEFDPSRNIKKLLGEYIEYRIVDNFSEALSIIERGVYADIYLIDCRLVVKPEVWDKDLFGEFDWDNFENKFIPKKFLNITRNMILDREEKLLLIGGFWLWRKIIERREDANIILYSGHDDVLAVTYPFLVYPENYDPKLKFSIIGKTITTDYETVIKEVIVKKFLSYRQRELITNTGEVYIQLLSNKLNEFTSAITDEGFLKSDCGVMIEKCGEKSIIGLLDLPLLKPEIYGNQWETVKIKGKNYFLIELSEDKDYWTFKTLFPQFTVRLEKLASKKPTNGEEIVRVLSEVKDIIESVNLNSFYRRWFHIQNTGLYRLCHNMSDQENLNDENTSTRKVILSFEDACKVLDVNITNMARKRFEEWVSNCEKVLREIGQLEGIGEDIIEIKKALKKNEKYNGLKGHLKERLEKLTGKPNGIESDFRFCVNEFVEWLQENDRWGKEICSSSRIKYCSPKNSPNFALIELFGFKEDYKTGILVICKEIAKHAYSSDMDKKIRIECYIEDENLVVRIADEGNGFSKDIKKTLSTGKNFKDSIMLINRYSSELCIETVGTLGEVQRKYSKFDVKKRDYEIKAADVPSDFNENTLKGSVFTMVFSLY